MNPRSLDLFCHVIDNFGDAGVSLRFARAFAKSRPGCVIRLFIDDPAVLYAIEPLLDVTRSVQTISGITFINSARLANNDIDTLGTADIVIEMFACSIPEGYLDRALFSSRLIINLEYLSTETWTEGYHCKESLLPTGSAKKYFFMPGFTNGTGGVLLNDKSALPQLSTTSQKSALIASLLPKCGSSKQLPENALTGTLFSYEHNFDRLLHELEKIQQPVVLLCFGEKSRTSMIASAERCGGYRKTSHGIQSATVHLIFMPFIPQGSYDALLYCTSFNIVRGEDSLVRALLTGKPFIWHAYPQDENYQLVKVEALMSMMRPFFEDESVYRSYHQLHIDFNNTLHDTLLQPTNEDFSFFFQNINKTEHPLKKLCYFIEQNCDLVKKLNDFIATV